MFEKSRTRDAVLATTLLVTAAATTACSSPEESSPVSSSRPAATTTVTSKPGPTTGNLAPTQKVNCTPDRLNTWTGIQSYHLGSEVLAKVLEVSSEQVARGKVGPATCTTGVDSANLDKGPVLAEVNSLTPDLLGHCAVVGLKDDRLNTTAPPTDASGNFHLVSTGAIVMCPAINAV